MGTMGIPIFYDDEPEKWVSWMDAFFAAESFSEFEKRHFANGFIGGEAHTWYCDEISKSGFDSWEDLKVRLIQRFSTRVVEAKEQPSLLDQIKQMSMLRDRLQRRWKEEDEAKKVPEEKLVTEETEEIVSCVRGKGSTDDPIPDLIPPMTKLEDLNEVHVDGDRDEELLAAMEDFCEETLPAEQKETVRKKKRWKKDLCYEEEDLIGFGLMREEGHRREDRNKGNVNSNNYAYQVFDQMHGEGKKLKKKRKKKRMKIECMMKRIKQELRFRELLVKQKRVLQELAKGKKLKLKHKPCKRKKTREIFSAVTTRKRARLWLKYVVHGKPLPSVSKLGRRIESESSACQVIDKLLEKMKYKFKQKLNQRKRVLVRRKETRVATAKTSEGAELKYQHTGYRGRPSFATSVGKRLMINCKKKKKGTEMLSGKQFALIWNLYLEPAVIRKKNRGRCKRSHCKEACLCCVKLSLLQSRVKQNEKFFSIELETRDKLKQEGVGLVFLVMVGTQERQTGRVYWVVVIGGAWDPGGRCMEETVEVYMSTEGEVTTGKEQLIGLNMCLRRKKEGNELKANCHQRLITFFREWEKRKKSNPDGKNMLFPCLSVGSECGHNTAPAKPMMKPLQSESTVKCELKKNTHAAVLEYKIRSKGRLVKKHGTPLAPEMGVGRRNYYQYEVQKLNAGAPMWKELNTTGLRTHTGPPEKWASKLVVSTSLGAIQYTETITVDADQEKLQVLYLRSTELDGGELGGLNNRLKTQVSMRELLRGKEMGISMVCLLKILFRAEVSKKRKMFQNFYLRLMLDRRGINMNEELMSQNGRMIKALILLELDVAKQLQKMLRQEEVLSREMGFCLKLLEGDEANLVETMEWVKAYGTQAWNQFKALDCYCKLQSAIYMAIPIVQARDLQDEECSWNRRIATISCHLAPTLRIRLNSKRKVMISVGIG